MTSLASLNLVPIIIAILIGIAVAWWLFSRKGSSAGTDAAGLTKDVEVHEGSGLTDEGAAAAADVAGEFLGVDVHAELPGASGPPDDLRQLKGVGPKLAVMLNEAGIIRYDQLASLSPAQIASLDARMGPFAGRVVKDRLVEQASYLARGDRAGFEATFGNLGSS